MTKKSKNKECFISCLKNHVLVHINCSYFNEFVLAFIYLLLIAMTSIGVSLVILFEYFFRQTTFSQFLSSLSDLKKNDICVNEEHCLSCI